MWSGCSGTVAAPPKDAAVDPKGIQFFEKSIRSVLVDHCYKCHSAKATKIKAGLVLDTEQGLLEGGDSGPALVPHQPNKSLLIEAIRHEGGLEMPPTGKLPDKVIADFEKWIKMGAPYPAATESKKVQAAAKQIDWKEARQFWSFQPIKATATPGKSGQHPATHTMTVHVPGHAARAPVGTGSRYTADALTSLMNIGGRRGSFAKSVHPCCASHS